MSYTIVSVPDSKLIGGHYAVQDKFGRIIGEAFRLDFANATTLQLELEKARKEGVELRESWESPERSLTG